MVKKVVKEDEIDEDVVESKDVVIEDDDEDDYDESEYEEEYEGETNEEGEKHGHGKLYTVDGFIMEGEWVNDVLNGPGTLIYDDVFIEGTYVNSEFNGKCREYTLEERILTFEGRYKDGERHGPGILYNIDGSRIKGIWRNSILGGDCIFFYPDERFFIKGTWKNGEFIKGKVETTIEDFDLEEELDTLIVKRDEATSKKISSQPTLTDAFEQYYCYVKQSDIPNSGEGLFARTDIPANRLVSYYNGLRIDPKLADERDWSFNSNTMYLDKNTYIDIPPEWSSTDDYCASLGHKANHSKSNNTVYRQCYHPRFGDIKCIRSIKPIAKDEEILVDYDYEEKDKPQWYIDLEKQVSSNATSTTIENKPTNNDEDLSTKKLKTK